MEIKVEEYHCYSHTYWPVYLAYKRIEVLPTGTGYRIFEVEFGWTGTEYRILEFIFGWAGTEYRTLKFKFGLAETEF